MRPLFTAKYLPKFMFGRSWDSWGLMNIPMNTFMANITIDESHLLNVIIQMKDPNDHQTIDAITTRLEINAPYATVEKSYS